MTLYNIIGSENKVLNLGGPLPKDQALELAAALELDSPRLIWTLHPSQDIGLKPWLTLRSWLSEEELTLTSVSDEILDTEGSVYGRDEAMWWVCPLLVVQSDPTGTRVLEEEEEENFRDWLDPDGLRPSDLSKPNDITYA